jgi:hypothetical protein
VLPKSVFNKEPLATVSLIFNGKLPLIGGLLVLSGVLIILSSVQETNANKARVPTVIEKLLKFIVINLQW